MARLDQVVLFVLCVTAAPVASVRLLRHPNPAQAATGDPSALQFLLKDRQGVVFERPLPSSRSSLEKRHQLDIYQQNQQWYADAGSNRDRQEADGEFNEDNTYIQLPEADHPGSYGSSHRDASADDRNANHQHTEGLRFIGSHVARHPLFEESNSFPTEYHPSVHDAYTNNQVFPPIPTKSSIKKVSSFGGQSPFLTRRPPPAAAASVAIPGAAPAGEDRDDFLHHTSSYEHDPTQYHVTSTYQEPASSYQEEDGGLFGKFKKYGGAMAPLLLATGLLFLFPSVQTITSASSRRRRRDLDVSGDAAAEKTLLLVERLQTMFASIDEDRQCPSQLFCQLGEVIADSDSPARVIKYMKQFYRDGEANMKIMKKAAYAKDPKCHLYACSDHETDTVTAGGSHQYE